MPRILIRSHKNPFTVADAETTHARNLIGNNTGNLVFSQAVYRLLSTPDAKLETSKLAGSKARGVNSGFDHVVIPLANAFRPDYEDTLDALSTLIEQLTVPVTVVGVGAQAALDATCRDDDKLASATTRFVRAVLNRSPSIGVRGEFTRGYLRALGFGDEHVKVIGCPSMFMYGPNLRVEKPVDAIGPQSRIALNVSPYVKGMGALSRQSAERYPRLVYMGQNIQTLELMLYGQYPGSRAGMIKSGAPVTLDHPLVRQNRIRFFLDPSTWIEHLAGYDFSFGTRIHGNIAALIAGTPALLLAHDSRTLELAEYHEIPHRTIGTVPANADVARMYAESDWSALNAGHAARWEMFAAFLAEQGLTHAYHDGQNAAVFDKLLADTDFPPPVETIMALAPEQLYEMRRRIRDRDDGLRTRIGELMSSTFRWARGHAATTQSGVWNRIDRAVHGLRQPGGVRANPS